MTEEDRKLFEQIKKMSICVNVAGKNFEKIKMLEVLKKTLTEPSDKNEVDAEIAKLRASPEFKENEIQKKIEDLNTDF